ncbi:hypothetical protein [Aquitalea aquatica]|uniref:N-acetylmuramoyl-L-alanine amidase n=1 Tax=Aquitalea aquatica TaxID=3044273 RepID=A0A838Y115_9NEIS|nr:hypothetical protein [Aquitalea magnusonii]MBA4707598.1 hypothetical protein [Aquitalea magnusonii]
MSRTINLIVIHCAASPNGKVLGSASKSAAAIIDQWHAQRGSPPADRHSRIGLAHFREYLHSRQLPDRHWLDGLHFYFPFARKMSLHCVWNKRQTPDPAHIPGKSGTGTKLDL